MIRLLLMSVERPMSHSALVDQFGRIDIYLFDLLLRGVITAPARVLDAGCGGGRNLRYLLGNGFDVWGVDRDEAAVGAARRMAAEVGAGAGGAGESGGGATPAPGSPPSGRFQTASVEDLPFADGTFDVVLSSAVLHFAESPGHWQAMVDEMWRVLSPGGLLWARLASDIGIEDRVKPIGGGRHHLPDGSDRYLVSERVLLDQTARLGGTLVDPIKTTNVQGLRCMTTWVVRKGERVVSPEVYSAERKAEFILSNAVDEGDYLSARESVREMGLDPDTIPHDPL